MNRVTGRISLFRTLRENVLALVGTVIIVIFVVVALGANVLTPYEPNVQDPNAVGLSPGSPGHLLGTDSYGRDTATRLFYGARISLWVGIAVVIITVVFGVFFGILAGYYKRLDAVIMRGADIMFAFPDILLALLIMSILGTNITNIIIAISIGSIPSCARVVRGSVLQARDKDYVGAIRALGGSDLRIAVKHILPNVMAPVIVFATMRLGSAILSTAALSYLGLGAQPPTPEWGAMISEGQKYMFTLPHLIIVPGVAIALVIFSFNVVGDALRDRLDPKLAKA
ncbi:ABC transporter permease [Microbacterium esteraromaticum]|uniref:ABC transporter permease n=1 Tax=Microbacterium esteraromaticum TaxID=57043 RepID=A0A939IQM7_9MICO|nr:ABC transporter permease [Microbacterium esteraromaticum]MBN8204860.1 ABC transporter permease [Microbacterium esteraromaticum]MBN8415014.1 ABC transporter permease [Microbacterium esteraromaticum]WDH79014.1 ABC transporter permease [Microbacterium esteraromaticum]